MLWPDRPVLVDEPAADYHADLHGDVPTLSRSAAHQLLSTSPAHVYASHPRLGGGAGRAATKAMDLGTLTHALLLADAGAPKRDSLEGIEVHDVPDWRGSQKSGGGRADLRESIIARGLVPIRLEELSAADLAAVRITRRLEALGIFDLGSMRREVTVLWEEPWSNELRAANEGYGGCAFLDGVRCRARLDALSLEGEVGSGRAFIYDLKIVTSGPANPDKFIRSMPYEGLDIQAAGYVRAVEAVYPELAGRVDFRFLLCEREGINDVIEIDPGAAFLALGASKWQRAVARWADCLETDRWPTRGESGPVLAECPSVLLERELEISEASQ